MSEHAIIGDPYCEKHGGWSLQLTTVCVECLREKDNELTRLRKAIEEAPPPKCDCESTRKFVVPIHHSKTCSVTLWELWKREALRGKSEPE